MVEVTVDRILLNPIAEYRVVILKEIDAERYLPIYIGRFEADAIAIRLQGHEHHRPLTHDLLNNMIAELGGEVSHILVNDMRNDTFYARIFVNVNGQELDIDSRPSDAIALAVRCDVPIFVEEEVMQTTGITPEPDISESIDGEELEAFRNFVDGLDLDDLPIQ
jgi:bifunctional DNase/RNase